MKKIMAVLILFSAVLAFVSGVSAAQVTEDDLKGDSGFVQKILSVQNENSEIDSDAIYVATDGSDGNNGTIDSPYATVYYAIAKAAGGKTIYVRGGIYNQQITITKSGTADKYITIKNYPGEKPVFDHTNYSTDGGAIVDISNVDYVHIEGLKLCNKNLVAHSGYGVKMNRGSHIIMKNLEICNINVPDPKSSSVGANAIILYANNASTPISNVLIDSCYVHDCETGWSEGISVNGNSEYINVINNRIDNIGNIGLDFAGNFNACKDDSLDQARYCTAIGNVVSRCISPNATSYGLYCDGGRNVTFDRNIVYGCSGGIEIGSEEGAASSYPVKDIVVKNNLVYNNIEAGLSVGGYDNPATGIVYNTKIYNNTLVNNGNENYGKELGINKTNGVDIRNNIFYKNTTDELIKIRFDETQASNITFGSNCYYSGKTADSFSVSRYGTTIRGFDNWKAESGETGIFENPLFNDDYTIPENSPCVDIGDSSVVTGTYDAAGNARIINIVDIGCYEYQDGSLPTQATTVTETTTETTTENSSNSTEITTEEKTETTTEFQAGSSVIWDFTDSNWSDKVTGKVLYEVNGLTVYHNGSSSGINGFKFDKNTKSPATGGYYIKLNAKKGSKITVYVNYNSSKTPTNISLTLASLIGGETTAIDSGSISALKTGEYKIELSVPDDGEYVIYTNSESGGSAYYNKVVLEVPEGKSETDHRNTAEILRYVSGISNNELVDKDINGDGNLDLLDAVNNEKANKN